MQIKKLLMQGCEILNQYTNVSQLESIILLSYVLDKPKTYLYAHSEIEIDESKVTLFFNLIEKRKLGIPIAYLTGQKEFWSLSLLVNPATLIPRPETELLVETILTLFPKDKKCKLLDLGTGSGAIAIAVAKERPEWQVLATDVSEEALKVASNNAQRLQIKNISFLKSNWFTDLPNQVFEIIVSNPPYIAEKEWETYQHELHFEPKAALVSGEDGFYAIQNIIGNASDYLKSDGYLLIEHGFEQATKTVQLLRKAGFMGVKTLKDLAGHERVTIGKKQY